MNIRKSAFLRSFCGGTLTLAALAVATSAAAESTTYYSSAECVPVFSNDSNSTPIYRNFSGRLYNDSSNRGLLVHCPVAHTGGASVSGTVMALDRSSDNDIVCDLKSVDEIGSLLDSARESSGGSYPWPLPMHFPEIAVDDTGSAFFDCFIPSGQAIQSYRVTEH